MWIRIRHRLSSLPSRDRLLRAPPAFFQALALVPAQPFAVMSNVLEAVVQ